MAFADVGHLEPVGGLGLEASLDQVRRRRRTGRSGVKGSGGGRAETGIRARAGIGAGAVECARGAERVRDLGAQGGGPSTSASTPYLRTFMTSSRESVYGTLSS